MNYTELQTAVAEYLDRTDLTSRIQSFIDLAQKRVMYDIKFRGVEASTTVSLTSGGSTVTPPTRFRSVITLKRPDGTVLKRRSISYIEHYNSDLDTATGAPEYYAVYENIIHVAPVADANYTLPIKYYEEAEPLSGSNADNYFSENVPQLLLYASLLESAPFLHNDERIATWEKQYRDMVRSLMGDQVLYGTDEAVQ